MLREWDARLGALDARGGHFIPRAVAPHPSGAAPAAVPGFCNFLDRGGIYVAAPSMSALVEHVLSAAAPRLQITASTKARPPWSRQDFSDPVLDENPILVLSAAVPRLQVTASTEASTFWDVKGCRHSSPDRRSQPRADSRLPMQLLRHR